MSSNSINSDVGPDNVRALLRQALAAYPTPAPEPHTDTDDGMAMLPIAEHRRQTLFGFTAAALSAADAGRPTDLHELIGERLVAALDLLPVVRPLVLFDWLRSELQLGPTTDAEDMRKFALAVAAGLMNATANGKIVPDGDWETIHRPVAPSPTDVGGDTKRLAGDTVLARAGLVGLNERVKELGELADPRIAEWFVLHTVCGLPPEALAGWYDVAADEIHAYLVAVRERPIPSSVAV